MPGGGVAAALAVAVIATSVSAALHALLSKREPRAALGWIAISLGLPLAGPLLYFVFGINRIRTRARRLTAEDPDRVKHREGIGAPDALAQRAETAFPPPPGSKLGSLVRLSGLITEQPLRSGQRIEILRNGEEAFPAMLEAIAAASESVYLATYIFESNKSGRAFVEALSAAHARGVRTRVLLDGIGELYGWPRVRRLLARAGVPVQRFLPPRILPPQFNINLRNHRKILVVDGTVAFTGGMNIGDRNLALDDGTRRTEDVHFRLEGPVAHDIESAFRADWEFVCGEVLPFTDIVEEGTGAAHARAILDGPNEDVDKLEGILIGALGIARQRAVIVTPYFLPSREHLAALKSASLRGVEITIILPEKNNLPYVHWASRNILWELLHWDVRVIYQAPPFAHTKLFLVDDEYVQIGSANIDPRSLRLNFELSVEVYDRALAAEVWRYVEAECLADSREVSLTELDARPIWQQVRDAACWLASPYL
ncbi:MAG: cardiolipin synthase [Acidobacteria bacterium]|nr:cardiolipin synthase [Acidobacteriota bacterium]